MASARALFHPTLLVEKLFRGLLQVAAVEPIMKRSDLLTSKLCPSSRGFVTGSSRPWLVTATPIWGEPVRSASAAGSKRSFERAEV